MIYQITGFIINITNEHICIAVGDFIVLSLFAPRLYRFSAHEKITLFTLLSWNQETGPTLFGFISLEEKKLFELLLECQGIGPKVSLAVLNTLANHELKMAVHLQQTKTIERVPGIGKKKSEIVLLELKNLFNKHNIALDDEYETEESNIKKEFTEALKQLGYNQNQINDVFQKIPNDIKQKNSLQELLQQALLNF